MVTEETDEDKLAEALTQHGFPGSFVWAKDATPCAYARLCRAGFLTIAGMFEDASSQVPLLPPFCVTAAS